MVAHAGPLHLHRVSQRTHGPQWGCSLVTDASGASPTARASPLGGPSLEISRWTTSKLRDTPQPPTSWGTAFKMPEVTANDRQKAIAAQARDLYGDGKFKAALATFKKASSRSCTVDVTMPC